jgi:hypothetical protein
MFRMFPRLEIIKENSFNCDVELQLGALAAMAGYSTECLWINEDNN